MMAWFGKSKLRVALAGLAVLLVAGGAGFAMLHKPEPETGWHGNWFPNVELTDQDGTKVRFYDDLLKNKIVSINFIYTNCGDICPLDTANLTHVAEKVGDRLGKSVFMYSISIDEDSPEALRRYMRSYNVPKSWRFFTGSRADVELLQTKLGIRAPDPANLSDHDTSYVSGNERTGQWIRRSAFEDAQLLANILVEQLSNYKDQLNVERRSYSEAPEIADSSLGATLYRTRCDSCHTIGQGDRLGPDLAGVMERRPRAWLREWLKDPQKMVDDKDPTAVAMVASYRNLVMPNFSLEDPDIDNLLGFLERQDRALADRQRLTGANEAATKTE